VDNQPDWFSVELCAPRASLKCVLCDEYAYRETQDNAQLRSSSSEGSGFVNSRENMG
jgi:hypothetical protein